MRDPAAWPEARHRRHRAEQAGVANPPGVRRRAAMAIAIGLILAALLAPATSLALAVNVRAADAPATAGSRPFGRSARLAPPARVPPLRPPVVGPVVRAYEAAAGPFGPGHRGVDLGAGAGAAVQAPAAGRVVFAGGVAGTVWMSIGVAPGVVATLGPLRDLAVAAGRSVATGTRVAVLAPGHGSAGHPTTLHLSLRVDGAYVDPLPWLTGFGRPRLAPLLHPGGPH
jgi:murein DD-endopeptidase MepM/ murein hydrolase activator NlpD